MLSTPPLCLTVSLEQRPEAKEQDKIEGIGRCHAARAV